MDEYYNVKRLALVLAVQAEIEGMKAENTFREGAQHDPTYREPDFTVKAEQLRYLAYAHDEQL